MSKVEDNIARIIIDKTKKGDFGIEVANLILQRAKVGLEKYGVTLEDAPGTLQIFCQHALEEACDLAAYLEKMRLESEKDSLLSRILKEEVDKACENIISLKKLQMFIDRI